MTYLNFSLFEKIIKYAMSSNQSQNLNKFLNFHRSITKILGDWWAFLPNEDKFPYKELAKNVSKNCQLNLFLFVYISMHSLYVSISLIIMTTTMKNTIKFFIASTANTKTCICVCRREFFKLALLFIFIDTQRAS